MDPVTAFQTVTATVGFIVNTIQTIHYVDTKLGQYLAANQEVSMLQYRLIMLSASLTSIKNWLESNPQEVTTHLRTKDAFHIGLVSCNTVIQAIQKHTYDYDADSRVDKMKHMWNRGRIEEHGRNLDSQMQALILLIQTMNLPTRMTQDAVLDRPESIRTVQVASDAASIYTKKHAQSVPHFRPGSVSFSGSSDSNIEGSEDTEFLFDDAAINSVAYRRAYQRLLRSTNLPPTMEERNSSENVSSTTQTGLSSSVLTPGSQNSGSLPSSPPTSPPAPSTSHSRSRKSFLSIRRKLPGTTREATFSLYAATVDGNLDLVRELISRGANVNHSSEQTKGQYPLDAASKLGYIEIMRCLLESGAKSDTWTLREAFMGGQLDAFRLLADRGVDDLNAKIDFNPNSTSYNQTNYGNSSFLYAAAKKNDVGFTKFLVERRVNINNGTKLDETPLHVSTGQCTRLLLEAGAEVFRQDNIGCTPLHWRIGSPARCSHANCDYSTCEELLQDVRLLLQYKSPVNTYATKIRMLTPLHAASFRGSFLVVKALIAAGAQIDGQQSDKSPTETPLQLAVEKGNRKVIRLLIQNGANLAPKVLQEHARTILNYAILNGSDDAVIRILLEAGASPINATAKGDTPLHLAIKENRLEVAKLLLQRGALLRLRNNAGQTPGDIAVLFESVQFVRLLARYHWKTHPQSPRESPGLRVAIRQGSTDIVRAFVEAGDDVNLAAVGKQTPLQTAVLMGREELVKYLCTQGADKDARVAEVLWQYLDITGNETPSSDQQKKLGILAPNLIFLAIDQVDVDVLKALIQAGADLHRSCQLDGELFGLDRISPLCFAFFRTFLPWPPSNLEVVEELLSQGTILSHAECHFLQNWFNSSLQSYQPSTETSVRRNKAFEAVAKRLRRHARQQGHLFNLVHPRPLDPEGSSQSKPEDVAPIRLGWDLTVVPPSV